LLLTPVPFASDTPPRSSPLDGLMLNATTTPPSCRCRRSCAA